MENREENESPKIAKSAFVSIGVKTKRLIQRDLEDALGCVLQADVCEEAAENILRAARNVWGVLQKIKELGGEKH